MSGYILCQTKKAETPYYVENISVNLYTLEELCYYLYQNLYLIDKTVVNEELCGWIERELELPALAAKLRPHLGKFADMEDILYPIFKEINYLTYEELKSLNARLAKLNRETPAARKKQKGDALVRNGMYVQAMKVYQELLEEGNFPEEDAGFEARVYHNLGCAYSYLFQMEKALDCFEKAWEKEKNDENLKTYLLAYRSIKTPIEYESRLTELGAEPSLLEELQETWTHFAKKPEKPVYSQHIDGELEKFMKDYHRSTGS